MPESLAIDAVTTDLLTQASLHMALELVKDRVRLESHTRLFGDFVAALTSEHGDASNVERAATAAGISVHRPIRVFRGRLCKETAERSTIFCSLDTREADTFAGRYLDPVRAYDAKHGSDLDETITAYIDTGGSITGTANRLHIHASTLKYQAEAGARVDGHDADKP